MAGDSGGYEAYRCLVAAGEPGWRILVKHLLIDLTPTVGEMRVLAPEMWPIPAELEDAFWRYHDAEQRHCLADERWTMAYDRVCLDDRSLLHFDLRVDALRAGLVSDPGAAGVRLAIAALRNFYQRGDDYPWRGPADAQRAAITEWLAYVAANPPPEFGH